MSECAFLDAIAIAIASQIVAILDRDREQPCKFPGTVAHVVLEVAEHIRVIRSVRHQAIDPSGMRLRR
jgi:hypothetical protein